MNRTGRTGFGLHLHNMDRVTENVLLAGCGPLVHIVSHGAGRSDGVNSRYFGKRISYMRRSGIAIHTLLGSYYHGSISSFYGK